MGYTTDFSGSLEFNKPVTDELRDYIDKFNRTRRMVRDVNKIKEIYPNWAELCFNGDLGREGEYFIGGDGFMGQDNDDSIINYNHAPASQPGLWCQWVIYGDCLEWDGNEKFYNYIEWLEYLINHFFKPIGYILNGDIIWQGEDSDDCGTISVKDNVVDVKYGMHVYAMEDIETEDLIEELERRGYKVS